MITLFTKFALLIISIPTAICFVVDSKILRIQQKILSLSYGRSDSHSDQTLSRREAWVHAAAVATSSSQLLLPTSAAVDLGSKVPTVKLGTGNLEVSRTIQGYWQLAGGHGRYKEADAVGNMEQHFRAGITTLDTADIYGPSEVIMGKFLATRPTAVPCTKFCCFRFLDEITREEVRSRVQKACERLQVSTLPLVQFFWLNFDVKRYVDVALYLTELKEEGLIQEIGATNFNLSKLKELKEAGVPLVSHQVQLSALDRRPVQSGMAEWCAENQISLTAYGSIGSGILSSRFLGKNPPTQGEKDTASMRMYSNTAERFGSWSLVQELLKTMDAIATDVHNDGRCTKCTIANVAQRFVLQTPSVASIVIGVRNQNHLSENVRTHSFTLNNDEINTLNSIVAQRIGPKGDVWDIERGLNV